MSKRAQKWNVGLERRKERETFCGRLRKRTPFLRLRAQLQQDVRHRVQKSNTGPERRKERETLCGRFGKWTRFLRWRTQLQQDVRKSFSNESLPLDTKKDISKC